MEHIKMYTEKEVVVAVRSFIGDAFLFGQEDHRLTDEASFMETGIIDSNLKWTAGGATYIQLGDLFDRGLHVRETLDFLIRLQAALSSARHSRREARAGLTYRMCITRSRSTCGAWARPKQKRSLSHTAMQRPSSTFWKPTA